jgi:C1A family cysteine protease
MKLRRIAFRVAAGAAAIALPAVHSDFYAGSSISRAAQTPLCEDQPVMDWRATPRASPVKDQTASCNSCWAFATLASYEDSYYQKSGVQVDASEQQLLDCAATEIQACGAGVLPVAFVRTQLLANEAEYPYVHARGQCRTAPPGATVTPGLRALGVVTASNATVAIAKTQIKKALCQRGAVATLVNATPELDSFKGDVFDQPAASPIVTHALAIVGWNDTKDAWLVKNSRGPNWGDGGYMWIRYTTNGIGRNTVSIDADAPLPVPPPSTPQPPTNFTVQ